MSSVRQGLDPQLRSLASRVLFLQADLPHHLRKASKLLLSSRHQSLFSIAADVSVVHAVVSTLTRVLIVLVFDRNG